jgi:hypothetical protein
MDYRYRYLDDHDAPLSHCPFCGASLTSPDSIALTVSIAERRHDLPTQLDAEGWLMDVDRLVANGYHSATCCATCGEMLVEYEHSKAA